MLYALAALATAARYHELPPMEPADLAAPGVVQTVDVDGVEVAYVDVGQGPPLVLVHGLGSWMDFWAHNVDALSEHHRVLVVDLPGYGRSGRPDAPYTPPWYADVLVGLLDALELDEAVFVGHSMGGQISLTAALEHPERVSALVLAAPAGIETFEPGAAAWMKAYWHEARALEPGEHALRATFSQQVFRHLDEHAESLLEARVRMTSTRAFAGTSVAVSRNIAGMLDHPVAGRLGEIEAPTLVVFGEQDRMIPSPVFTGGRAEAVGRAAEAALPHASLVMLDDAGHTVHHDQPDAFHAAVLDFLGAL